MKFRVLPKPARIGNHRQVAAVEIEAELNVDQHGVKCDYPFRAVEHAIDRAFHRFLGGAETVITQTNGGKPVAAIVLDGDREIGKLVIYPMES